MQIFKLFQIFSFRLSPPSTIRPLDTNKTNSNVFIIHLLIFVKFYIINILLLFNYLQFIIFPSIWRYLQTVVILSRRSRELQFLFYFFLQAKFLAKIILATTILCLDASLRFFDLILLCILFFSNEAYY